MAGDAPAIATINDAIGQLDFRQVAAWLFADDRGEEDPGVEVCEASLQLWHQYVRSENQALISRAMEWRSGRIYIVELPGALHDNLVAAIQSRMHEATGTGTRHLVPCMGSYVDGIDLCEPDQAFGPEWNIGAVRPTGVEMRWGEFHTLKVEIGVCRQWRMLMEKAKHWATIPGVEYVLLVYVSPAMRTRQYGLFSVLNATLVTLVSARTPITRENTVQFDAHKLLSLPNAVPIPPNFADPVIIDLDDCVETVARRLH